MFLPRKTVEHIIFDCDSTLTTIEGVDELAGLVDKRESVSELTRKAIDGEVPLEGIFFDRLDMIRPTCDHIRQIGKLYCRSLSASARVILEIAEFLGKKVYILSSGYLPCLRILGDYLNVDDKHVFGVDLIFDREENYLYCPRDQILTLTDGKLRKVRELDLPRDRTVMIGDGANDLPVGEDTILFLGYQGNRDNLYMQKNAEHFLKGDDLLPFLALFLTKMEKTKLSKTQYAQVVKQSESMAAEMIVVNK